MASKNKLIDSAHRTELSNQYLGRKWMEKDVERESGGRIVALW